MALRPPPGHAPTRFLVRFPDEAAADEVRSRGGARLTLVLEDGTEVSAVVVGSSGATLRAEADRSLAGTPLRVGAEVTVSWAELDDLASVGGTLGSGGVDGLPVECSWPPSRVQRRSLRRCAVQLPAWIVRTGQVPEVLEVTTRDVSGGGMSLHGRGSDLSPGEHVVTMLRLPDRDLVLPAVVHWSRPDGSALGVRFERISQSDQDHLVQFVISTEAARA